MSAAGLTNFEFLTLQSKIQNDNEIRPNTFTKRRFSEEMYLHNHNAPFLKKKLLEK